MWRSIVHEEVFRNLILEAKNPEEILRLIKYRYKDSVPETFIEKTFSIDPTKRKSFTQWACGRYPDESNRFVHAINNGTLKKVFDFFYKNANTLSLSDMKTLEDAEGYAFTVHLDEYLRKDGDDKADDFDYDDVDDRWGVAQYHTYEASLKLGKDCIWCTANWYGNGYSYYKDYTGDGQIFVLIDKSGAEICNKRRYDFKRYQLFFDETGNKKNEFRDSKNELVVPEEIGFTEKLYEYFEERDLDPDSAGVSEEEQIERYDEWRYNNGLGCITIGGEDCPIWPEYDDTYDIRNADDCCYCIYGVNDDTYPIDNSPYEGREFYENSETFISRTFTVLSNESEDRRYVWKVDDDDNVRGFGGYNEKVSYGRVCGLNYFWIEDRLYFENETDSWDILASFDGVDDIIGPEQRNDGGIYLNIFESGGVVYLMKLLPDSDYEVVKYTRGGSFVLEDGEYVAKRISGGGLEKNNDSGIIYGKYVVADEFDENDEGYNFIPCINKFSDISHRVNILDVQHERLVFNDYRCYKFYRISGRLIFLQGQADSSETNKIDIMDMATGEMVVRDCTVSMPRSFNDGTFTAKDKNGKCIFLNTRNGSAEKYGPCDLIEDNVELKLVINENGEKVLVNLYDWTFISGVDKLINLGINESIVRMGNGETSLVTYVKDTAKQDITYIGKVYGGIKKLGEHMGGGCLLSFKCAGNQKLSIYSTWLKKYILKNYANEANRLGDSDCYPEFISVFTDNGIQLLRVSNLKFVGDGMFFTICDRFLAYSEGGVTVCFSTQDGYIRPNKMILHGNEIDYFPVITSLYYYGYDEEYEKVCDKQTYETIQNIRRKIESGKDEQVNEGFTEKFYTLLERMDKSKYNWL